MINFFHDITVSIRVDSIDVFSALLLLSEQSQARWALRTFLSSLVRLQAQLSFCASYFFNYFPLPLVSLDYFPSSLYTSVTVYHKQQETNKKEKKRIQNGHLRRCKVCMSILYQGKQFKEWCKQAAELILIWNWIPKSGTSFLQLQSYRPAPIRSSQERASNQSVCVLQRPAQDQADPRKMYLQIEQ